MLQVVSSGAKPMQKCRPEYLSTHGGLCSKTEKIPAGRSPAPGCPQELQNVMQAVPEMMVMRGQWYAMRCGAGVGGSEEKWSGVREDTLKEAVGTGGVCPREAMAAEIAQTGKRRK